MQFDLNTTPNITGDLFRRAVYECPTQIGVNDLVSGYWRLMVIFSFIVVFMVAWDIERILKYLESTGMPKQRSVVLKVFDYAVKFGESLSEKKN